MNKKSSYIISEDIINNKIRYFYEWLNDYFNSDKTEFKNSIIKHNVAKRTTENFFKNTSTDYNFETISKISEMTRSPLDEMFNINNKPHGKFFEDRWLLALRLLFIDSDNSLYNEIKYIKEDIDKSDKISLLSEHSISGLSRRINDVKRENKISLLNISTSISCSSDVITKKRLLSHSIRIRRLLKIALTLDCSIDYLVGNQYRKPINPAVDLYYNNLIELPQDEIRRISEIVYAQLKSHKELETLALKNGIAHMTE